MGDPAVQLRYDVRDLCHYFETQFSASDSARWVEGPHAPALLDKLFGSAFFPRSGSADPFPQARGADLYLPRPAQHLQTLHTAWSSLDCIRSQEYGLRALCAVLSEASPELLHCFVECGLLGRVLACLRGLREFERALLRGESVVVGEAQRGEAPPDARSLRCLAAVRRYLLLEALLLVFSNFVKPGVAASATTTTSSSSSYATDYLAALKAHLNGEWEEEPPGEAGQVGLDLQCPMAGALLRGRTIALGELALLQGLRLDYCAALFRGADVDAFAQCAAATAAGRGSSGSGAESSETLLAEHPLAPLVRDFSLQRELLGQAFHPPSGAAATATFRRPLLSVACAALLSCLEERRACFEERRACIDDSEGRLREVLEAGCRPLYDEVGSSRGGEGGGCCATLPALAQCGPRWGAQSAGWVRGVGEKMGAVASWGVARRRRRRRRRRARHWMRMACPPFTPPPVLVLVLVVLVVVHPLAVGLPGAP